MAALAVKDLEVFFWLAVCAAGAAAHFWLHPQREFFRSGLRVLGLFPVLPALMLLSHTFAFRAILSGAAGTTPAPDALPVPVICLRDALGWLAWMAHDAARLRDLGWPPLLLAVQAIVAATVQVWLCLVLPDDKSLRMPPPTDAAEFGFEAAALRPMAPVGHAASSHGSRWHEMASRWRGILLLAGIHLLAVLAQRPLLAAGRNISWLVGAETLLCFMPLSFVVAQRDGSIAGTGTAMLRLWRVAWFPWTAWALSALAMFFLLALALRNVALFSLLPDAVRWLGGGIYSAALHAWLFASGVLLLRRAAYLVPPSPASP